jgi:starch synthase
MRILFAASEALPYAKTGGLADVIEALPRALVKLGHEVAVFMPRYRGVKSGSVVMPSLTIPQGTRLRFPAIVNGSVLRGVRYFFLDDPFYFDRDGIYGDKSREFPDNAERFTEFSRATIEMAKHIWTPDVFHCHDWQTAMVPALLRSSYGDDPVVKDIPVVFTIHNIGYHGVFPPESLARAGIPQGLFHPGGIEFFGNANFLKGGLIYSDYLTTVSRKYAQEFKRRNSVLDWKE